MNGWVLLAVYVVYVGVGFWTGAFSFANARENWKRLFPDKGVSK